MNTRVVDPNWLAAGFGFMASGTLETDTGVSGTFVHFSKVVDSLL